MENKSESIRRREHVLESIDRPFKKVEVPALGLEYLKPQIPWSSDVFPHFSSLSDNSDEFYTSKRIKSYHSYGREIVFESEVVTKEPKNNRVYAEFYHGSSNKVAVVLLPNWNADYAVYRRISKIFSKFGIDCLLLHLPYHEQRRPANCEIANHMISPNIGLTIQSVQQSVLDARDCITWLEDRKYESLGVVGLSLGSAIATLVAAHDSRVTLLVQILMASNFAEVVWKGLATKHLRKSFDGWIELDQLKRLWECISPDTYAANLSDPSNKILMITGKYDPVFPPYLAEKMATLYDYHGVNYRWDKMACGHYSLGDFPYSLISIIKVIVWLRARK